MEAEAEAPEERVAAPRTQEQERQQRLDEQYERREARRVRRNMLDRTNYHYAKMVELEIELAEAKRNKQNLIVADILEEMEKVRAGAERAG